MTTTTRELHKLASRLGVSVMNHNGKKKGYYLHNLKVISMQKGLSEREYRSTLAHELGHAIRGDIPTGTPFDEYAERAADRIAANILITKEAYMQAEALHGGHVDAMANELGVTRHILKIWKENYKQKAA